MILAVRPADEPGTEVGMAVRAPRQPFFLDIRNSQSLLCRHSSASYSLFLIDKGTIRTSAGTTGEIRWQISQSGSTIFGVAFSIAATTAETGVKIHAEAWKVRVSQTVVNGRAMPAKTRHAHQ